MNRTRQQLITQMSHIAYAAAFGQEIVEILVRTKGSLAAVVSEVMSITNKADELIQDLGLDNEQVTNILDDALLCDCDDCCNRRGKQGSEQVESDKVKQVKGWEVVD